MDACFIRFEKALALELGDGIGVDASETRCAISSQTDAGIEI